MNGHNQASQLLDWMQHNKDAARIAELRKEIEKANAAYYDKDEPIMSDAAYDQLTRELRELEEKHPELITPDSPTQHVGGHASSSFNDVKHIQPLQSLRDVFNKDSVHEWLDKMPSNAVTIETKVDGLSCAITYIDGKFHSAATRGDGRIGEDVTENVRRIANVPKTLHGVGKGTIIIRCEIYMPTAVFEALNHDLESAGKKLFKNPRNAAAGSLRTKDADETGRRGLHAIAFCILHNTDDTVNFMSQSGNLQWLSNQGFETVKWLTLTDNATVDDIDNAIDFIDTHRSEYLFPIDGTVIKLDDIGLQTDLGGTDKYPYWAIAYKYPPEQKETTLLDIALQTGRTGVITPVAVFEPIELAGTTVTRATLHNQEFMDTILGGIAIGDRIVVHKSGEIIPEVLRVNHANRQPGIKDFTITTCPVCGSKAILGADENGNGTQMYCSNINCPAMTEGHLTYWCSRHVMDIEGLGPKNINKLIATGIQSPADLYKLDEPTLQKVFSDVTGTKIYNAIQNSKNRNIDRLIAGLGIQGVGRHIGTALAERYPDMESVINGILSHEIEELEGIGTLTAIYMEQWFANNENKQFIDEMKRLGMNMKSNSYRTKNTTSETQPLQGLTFVITGSFDGFSREDMKAYLESNGAKVSGSISKKTDYLLAGENGGSKIDKANSLGIPTINMEYLKTQLIRV